MNKDFFGIRPTISNRVSLRENWFNDTKDASLNANIRLGLSLRLRSWFSWLFRDKVSESALAEIDPATQDSGIRSSVEKDGLDLETNIEDRRQREIERLERMGIDASQIDQAESMKGDWISRDKAEIERKIKQREGSTKGEEAGLLQRSVESLAFNADMTYNTQDSLRRLAPGTTISEIIQIEDELIHCASISGNTITVTSGTNTGRGYLGTADETHALGKPVYMWGMDLFHTANTTHATHGAENTGSVSYTHLTLPTKA